LYLHDYRLSRGFDTVLFLVGSIYFVSGSYPPDDSLENTTLSSSQSIPKNKTAPDINNDITVSPVLPMSLSSSFRDSQKRRGMARRGTDMVVDDADT